MKLNVEAHEGDLSKMGCMILNHYIEYNKQRKQDPNNLFLGSCIMNSLEAKMKDSCSPNTIEKIMFAMVEIDYSDFILLLVSFPMFRKDGWIDNVKKNLKEFADRVIEDTKAGLDLDYNEREFNIEAGLKKVDEREYACVKRTFYVSDDGFGVPDIDYVELCKTSGFMQDFANIYVRSKLNKIFHPESFYDRFPGCHAVLSTFQRHHNNSNCVHATLEYHLPFDSIQEEIVKAAVENAMKVPSWYRIL